MTRSALLLGTLSLFLALTERVSGQDFPSDTVLTLQDVLAEVRANNASLRASQLQAEALTFAGAQAVALPDPVVTAAYQPFGILTAYGAQRSQWQVEQMLPYPGTLQLKGLAADLDAEIAALQVTVLEEDLVFQAKRAFFELYRIQQRTALIAAFQDRLADYAEAAATQYAVGQGMQQDILKAQLERNALDELRIQLDSEQRAALQALARLRNQPSCTHCYQTTIVQAPPPDSLDQDALLALARSRNSEAEALAAEARRADTQIALARKAFMPDFSLRFSYFDIASGNVPPTASGRDALAVGVSIKVPLQRARRQARLQQAQVQRRAIAARQEDLDHALWTQIAELADRLQDQQRQLAQFHEVLVPQAESARQASLSAYTAGRTSFLDLLDAERTLFALRSAEADLAARSLVTAAMLEKVLEVPSLESMDGH